MDVYPNSERNPAVYIMCDESKARNAPCNTKCLTLITWMDKWILEPSFMQDEDL